MNDITGMTIWITGASSGIGAMAGAIWGAANGIDGLPQDSLQKLEQQQRLQTVAGELYASKPV